MQTYKKEYFSDEVKEVVESTLTTYKTRYDSKVRLRLDDNKLVIRNLKSPDLTAEQSSRDIIHTVTLDEDQRPDLIALNFYGDARLYWVILGANGFREKSQIKKGTIIRIPAMNSLYGSNGLIVR
jgi:hypothetical protein